MTPSMTVSMVMEWIVYLLIIFLIVLVIFWIRKRWRVYRPRKRSQHSSLHTSVAGWNKSKSMQPTVVVPATWKETIPENNQDTDLRAPTTSSSSSYGVPNTNITTGHQKGIRWFDEIRTDIDQQLHGSGDGNVDENAQSSQSKSKALSFPWSSSSTLPSVRVISESETFYGAQSIFFSRHQNPEQILQIYVGYGLNYSGENRLQTCWNDLRAHYDWWNQVIRIPDGPAGKIQRVHSYILTDNPQPFTLPSFAMSSNVIATRLPPTLSNAKRIHAEITNLARKQHESGGRTEIVYYFSGHGYKRHTWDTREIDGQMECIVLSDGLYWDYEMTESLCKPLPSSTHMFAKFDSCHSGTVMNSRYTLNPLSEEAYQTSPYQYDANIWVLAGCADHTTSNSGPTPLDQSAFTRNLLSRNASTNILAQLHHSSSGGGQKTFIDLYYQVRDNLRSNGERQIPEFSCSHRELFRVPFFPPL